MKRWLMCLLWVPVLILAGCASPAAITAEPQTPSAVPATPTLEPTLPPTSTVEPTAEPSPTSPPPVQWMAYTGRDGNLYLLELFSGQSQQLTNDATQPDPSAEVAVQYSNAQWSSDGQFLAYKRDVGTRVSDGFQYVFELWVYNIATNTPQRLIENLSLVGLAWKPGTHLLTYAIAPEQGYFPLRGEVDSALAKGIWATDVDTTQNSELVPPQNGYSLANPSWSRDGRYLAFEEIAYYEGRGYFAYYDFETSEYTSWKESIGFFDWSPDGKALVFDTLTYAPRGDERIFLLPDLKGERRQFSPEDQQGYAFNPRFSPSGEQIAYLAELTPPDSQLYTLFVQPTAGGEAKSLGEVSYFQNLSWLPDGSGLVMVTGPYEERQVIQVALADGSVKKLAEGDSPALAP